MLCLIIRFPMPKSVLHRLQRNGDIRFRSGSVCAHIQFSFHPIVLAIGFLAKNAA